MCIWKVSIEDRLCKFCTLTSCTDRKVAKAGKWGTITSSMRSMRVGQEVRFPLGTYGACRTASTRLNSEFFARFLVTPAEDCVIVTRLS